MTDNKSKRGEPDRSRVNIHEPYEVSYWTKKFSVTAEELKAIVAKVGPVANDVEAEVKRRKAKA